MREYLNLPFSHFRTYTPFARFDYELNLFDLFSKIFILMLSTEAYMQLFRSNHKYLRLRAFAAE